MRRFILAATLLALAGPLPGCIAGAGYAYTPRPVVISTPVVPHAQPPRPLYPVAPG